jgi:hypothetical protein
VAAADDDPAARGLELLVGRVQWLRGAHRAAADADRQRDCQLPKDRDNAVLDSALFNRLGAAGLQTVNIDLKDTQGGEDVGGDVRMRRAAFE